MKLSDFFVGVFGNVNQELYHDYKEFINDIHTFERIINRLLEKRREKLNIIENFYGIINNFGKINHDFFVEQGHVNHENMKNTFIGEVKLLSHLNKVGKDLIYRLNDVKHISVSTQFKNEMEDTNFENLGIEIKNYIINLQQQKEKYFSIYHLYVKLIKSVGKISTKENLTHDQIHTRDILGKIVEINKQIELFKEAVGDKEKESELSTLERIEDIIKKIVAFETLFREKIIQIKKDGAESLTA